jgi:hypothetical protein
MIRVFSRTELTDARSGKRPWFLTVGVVCFQVADMASSNLCPARPEEVLFR